MAAPLSPFGNATDDLLFWVKEYLSRKIATLSSRTATDEDAKAISHYRMAIKKPETSLDEIDVFTRAIASHRFKSIRGYAYPIVDFVRFCINERKIQSITDINAAVVQEDYFGGRHYDSNATKKNHYRAVVSFVNFIEKNNFIDDAGSGYQFGMEPMPRSFDSKKIPDTLFPDEFEKFLEFIDTSYRPKDPVSLERNRLAIKLLCYMGIRVSELLGLKKKDFGTEYVDPEDSLAYLQVKLTGKGNKERIVYLKITKEHSDGSVIGTWLTPDPAGRVRLIPELQRRLDELDKNSSLLFELTEARMYQIVSEALKLAGLQKGKMGPHLLRHSYATFLLSKGVGLAQIQKLLGHESITTTTIYAKVIDREIKAAARVF